MSPERFFKTLTSLWCVIGCVTVWLVCYFFIDKPLALYLYRLHLGTLPGLEYFSDLGSFKWWVVVLFVIALGLQFFRKHATLKAKVWFLWLCVLLSGAWAGVLKVFFGRARPFLLFDQNQFGFYGFHLEKTYWSFPSGHTAVIASLCAGGIILYPKYFYWFLGGALIWVSGRVLLTHHFLSDVLGTFYLVFLFIAAFYWMLKRYAPQFFEQVIGKNE